MIQNVCLIVVDAIEIVSSSVGQYGSHKSDANLSARFCPFLVEARQIVNLCSNVVLPESFRRCIYEYFLAQRIGRNKF